MSEKRPVLEYGVGMKDVGQWRWHTVADGERLFEPWDLFDTAELAQRDAEIVLSKYCSNFELRFVE